VQEEDQMDSHLCDGKHGEAERHTRAHRSDVLAAQKEIAVRTTAITSPAV
jgi:hypothetical protein